MKISCCLVRTSVSSATLLCKTQNILAISMFWLLCRSVEFIKGFKRLARHKFFIFRSFIVWCCFLILLFPNIGSSEGLFRYVTSISKSLASSWQFPHHKHFLSSLSSLSSPPACSYCTEVRLHFQCYKP